jgi:hypothetical protein
MAQLTKSYMGGLGRLKGAMRVHEALRQHILKFGKPDFLKPISE